MKIILNNFLMTFQSQLFKNDVHIISINEIKFLSQTENTGIPNGRK